MEDRLGLKEIMAIREAIELHVLVKSEDLRSAVAKLDSQLAKEGKRLQVRACEVVWRDTKR